MSELAAFATKDAAERVLIVGPTPVDESKTRPVTFRPEREYRLDFVEEYNEIARRVADESGARFVDLFGAMRPHDGHWQEWDGVHLNASAHRRVADMVETAVGTLGWGAAEDAS
jgi:lysophospholipase L1-like esterase